MEEAEARRMRPGPEAAEEAAAAGRQLERVQEAAAGAAPEPGRAESGAA